jgi:hypothetical protein
MTNDKAKLQLALRALDTLSLAAIKGASDADLRVLRSLCQHWEMLSNGELGKRRHGTTEAQRRAVKVQISPLPF